MFGPSGFFTFQYTDSESLESARIAFAYKPPGRIRSGSIEDLIALLCRGPHVPDAAVILTLEGDPDNVGRLLDSEATRIARERMNPRTSLYHAELSLSKGSIVVARCAAPAATDDQDLSEQIRAKFRDWLQVGLSALFSPSKVVLRPPPGYAFHKPSGVSATIFLKPDLALGTSTANSYVALCIMVSTLQHRHYIDELETIFVDTMAIAPVAYELCELLTFSGKSKAPQIESFHSYGGMVEVARPLPWTSLCIISASTSMAMHGEWVASKNVSSCEVITLVTCDTAEKWRERALVSIDCGNDEPSSSRQRSIHIRGETFLPEPEAPKKVLIGYAHRCHEEVKKVQRFAGTRILDIYRRGSGASSKVRGLFVDGDELLENESLKKWVNIQVFEFVKASSKYIVHQGDADSRKFAEKVAGECKAAFEINLKIVEASHLASYDIQEGAGVIVCAAVVGKGSQLLDLSRQLRRFHTGPRLYLIGFQVAEEAEDIRLLVSNLSQSASESYEVRTFAAVAIGAQLLRSYQTEVNRFYPSDMPDQSIPSSLADRANVLGSSALVGSRALLPGPGAGNAMKLRPGFVFWGSKLDGEKDYQVEAIATIAIVLQRARENLRLPEEQRLSSSAFRHVMLSSENFSRFNDGLLQSAFLRCAFPSELDFRGDSTSSEFLKSLVLKCFARIGSESGEAALEFLAALVDGRLRLSEPHRVQVIEAAQNIAGGGGTLSEEFAFLLSSRPLTGAVPF